ncbi:hypothetical protein RFD09_001408 [Klebsiella aerogenes]|nr:hypothetical protein [Klebsiella aerogenes]HBQ3218840.1 hypothetical protein [Klebsiella aerogenes]HBT3003688.1 hypothetical protein [Klebsiella aerogenes]
MKSVKFSASHSCKRIGVHCINMIDAMGRGICSIMAFVSLIALDGWLFRLGGFAICFVLICLIIFLADWLKAKIQ